MRVLILPIKAMGQGCDKAGQHLPAQHHLVYGRTRLQQRHGSSFGFTYWGADMHNLYSDLSITSACFSPSWASVPFNARVMAGAIQGEAVDVKFRHSYGLVWKLLVHSWSGKVVLREVAWLCLTNFASCPAPAPNLLFFPPSEYPGALFVPHPIMVRQHLISRRSGSRGGSSRHQVRRRSTSGSPSSSAENPRYPNTRSDRGRASLRSSPFPLPHHHSPHTTLFHFRSSLNQPIITATISISFSKEAEQSILMTFPGDDKHRAGPSQNKAEPSRNRDKEDEPEGHVGQPKRKGKEDSATQLATLAMERRMMDGSDPQLDDGSREGEQQDRGQTKPDNQEDWSCPIVEEPATEEFIIKITNARGHFI